MSDLLFGMTANVLALGVLVFPLFVLPTCYLFSRAEEARSGKVLFDSAQAVHCTVMNMAAWFFAIGSYLVLTNMALHMGADRHTYSGELDWMPLQMGFSLCVPSGMAGLYLLVLWLKSHDRAGTNPAQNIFVRCFCAANVILLGSQLLLTASLALFSIINRAMSSQRTPSDGNSLTLLVGCFCLAFFLALNAFVFGQSLSTGEKPVQKPRPRPEPESEEDGVFRID
ncbi:MAG: hypothetical protein KDB61_05275 [Planctomycetes bacterium]|nr:hypothetical protein [Planctomycetota bacterium]